MSSLIHLTWVYYKRKGYETREEINKHSISGLPFEDATTILDLSPHVYNWQQICVICDKVKPGYTPINDAIGREKAEWEKFITVWRW